MPNSLFRIVLLLSIFCSGLLFGRTLQKTEGRMPFAQPGLWDTMKNSRIEDGGRKGGKCLRVQLQVNDRMVENWVGEYGAVTHAGIPVDPAKKYYLSGWVSNAMGCGKVWMHFWCYDAAGKSIGDLKECVRRDYTSKESSWQRQELSYIVFPAETATVRICLECNTAADRNIDLRMDDVEFREMPSDAPEQHVRIRVVPAITNAVILPDTQDFQTTGSPSLALTAARGEFESASFVVTAADRETLPAVLAIPGELKGADGQGVIPAEAINVRIVKCWFVGGRNWTGVIDGVRILRPELLLKDSAMVKADPVESTNYVRLSFPDGDKYANVTGKSDGIFGTPNEERPLPVAAFPVKDSATLQPVDIAAGQNQQFWVTIRIASSVKPGDYTGAIRLESAGKPLMELPVALRVLPIELEKPYYLSSMYYKGEFGGAGTIGAGNYDNSKNEAQYRAEMKDLLEHGVDNPPIHTWWNRDDLNAAAIETPLAIRQEVGISNRELFFWGGWTGNPQAEPEIQTLKQRAQKVIDIAKRHGAEKIYFMGIDEAQGDTLKSERPAWQAIHGLGAYVWVACSSGAFDLVGDLLDLAVVQGQPEHENAAPWHAQGHRILNYALPQCGVEKPETYRRNYGLRLWQCDYDGAMDHAYQCAYGNPYNDFDAGCRDEIMAYPTADGVVDTIEWEGYREGVDDVRYVTTLQNAIANAHGKTVAAQAQKYLDGLRKADIYSLDLDAARAQIIGWILKLQ